MTSADQLIAKVKQAESDDHLSSPASQRIQQWIIEPPFKPYYSILAAEIQAGDWKTLDNAFYAVLEFGTGGRRGKMHPVGTNVLNDRTIGESARGLADYIISLKGANAPKSCVIARDPRHNSARFADQCAQVLAAAGFKVYLFPEHRSTPLLSYAVRRLQCDGGIMITASHNPPSDNGFKCYASTGGQVVPPDDKGIIDRVKKVSSEIIPEAPIGDPAIVRVGEEIDEGYISAVVNESVCSARDLSIVYTPLHGVGETSVAAALIRAGFRQVNVLASQKTPDGNFPNVPGHVSNPEIPETLDLAIEEAERTGADLVLASDPDADRIGAAIPGQPGEKWTTFNGNQIGTLLAAFVMEKTKEAGKLRPEHYLVTTLVTSRMARALAKSYEVGVEDNLLVGFKWIGQRIDQKGSENFLYGFEESHGYVKGTYVRDKDAAVASLLFAEMVADLKIKSKGKTAAQYLDELYAQVGYFGDHLINRPLEGREGALLIDKLMKAFRERPPRSIAGLDVVEVYDYKTHQVRSIRDESKPRPLPQPEGDVLIFHLDQTEARFAVRPSGTEPKIKFYLFAYSPVNDSQSLAEAKRKTADILKRMGDDIEAYVKIALTS